MRMSNGKRIAVWIGAVAALAALAGGLGTEVAEAGKPSSGSDRPLVLDGTGGYSETAVFDSDAVLSAAQLFEDDSGVAAMEYVDGLRLSNGLEVAADGSLYAIFKAIDSSDTVQPTNANGPIQRQEFSGIVRYTNAGAEIAYHTEYTYGGSSTEAYSVEAYAGEELVAMDRVPATSSPLQEGDLIVLRWVDDDPTNASAEDDTLEVVHFRPSTSSGAFTLTEQGVLYSFDLPGSDEVLVSRFNIGQVAAGPNGEIYVSTFETVTNTSGAIETRARLWMLCHDGTSWSAADVEPPFDYEPHIEVDGSGNLYVQGDRFGADAGVIFRLDAGGTDYEAFAAFDQSTSSHSFFGWTADAGNFAIALQKPPSSKPSTWNVNYFVGLVNAAETTVFADRIADTASTSVVGMTADADSIYVTHADRYYDASRNRYDISRYTVYRLEGDAGGGDTGGGDTGGGDTGGGGKGNGKGKKK